MNLCLDGKNRIIASDQFGGLYRFKAPPKGETLKESAIEKIPANIRAANGLLWAFDSLYVAVNDYEKKDGERSLQAHGLQRRRPT